MATVHSSPFVLVGHVEEHGANGHVARESGRWHFSCRVCDQRMRMRAFATFEFDCATCEQLYKVYDDGSVYASTSTVGHAPEPKDLAPVVVPLRQAQGASQRPTKAGFFGRAAAAISDASEEAHGARLRAGLTSTGQHLQKLEPEVIGSMMTRYLEKRQMLANQRANWSRDGRIKMGSQLQQEAKKHYDFNQAESYALWLAGAWLESAERRSADAEFVHDALNKLALNIQ